MSVSLIPDSNLPKLQSRSKIVKCVLAKTGKKEEPHSKRRKITTNWGQPYSITAPDEEDVVSLTTAADLPKFTFPMISCQLLLQWSYSAEPGASGDVMPQNGEGGACRSDASCQWICGQITLKAEDVVDGKFNIKLDVAPQEVCEVRRILQCLNTCQLETPLQLQSSFLSKTDLIAAFKRFGLANHNLFHSYIDLDLGMFYLLRVDLDPKEQGQGLWITVHSNDENQLLMFIHMLYSGLPDDLNIIDGKRGNMAAAMESALNHMVQEVNQSCHSIGKALKSAEQGDSMEFDLASADQSVESLRQSFEQKKRKFMEDDVKPSASQSLLHSLNLQSLTDGAVSRMVKKSESL